MTQATSISKLAFLSTKALNYGLLLRAFVFGLILPLGFAPFHIPGAAILSIALFYAQLIDASNRHSFLNGLFFGLGYFGLGISWIYISIHEYGHLNSVLSAAITLLFLLYLSLFPAVLAILFKKLNHHRWPIYSCFLFSALWVLFEFCRANFLSGFPWLLVGFSQFDTPLKYFFPIVGVFGVGFLACFAASLLASISQFKGIKRYFALCGFVLLLLLPTGMKDKKWVEEKQNPISIGVIQANLSMRDKWDENLFWQLLGFYQLETEKLLGTQLIVLPESAIPLPPSFIQDVLTELDAKAKQAGSAIVLGIPKPTSGENSYFNALISLGAAKGFYSKQHLVPFGEYTPQLAQTIGAWLGLPDNTLVAGKKNQALVKVHRHPVATLICYELAYGELLRRQLPKAEWIISISDDGWFGHSLAMYQHLQMAQVRSLEAGRYQVVANNDGLSSVINSQGEITASLPAFSAGILKTTLLPATGLTPWASTGDTPVAIFCLFIVLFYGAYRFNKN